jgi:hypothetical protein
MADNYNILEPVTTPSGTQQRSIRAIEISSQLHAGAVLVHGTTGAVLLGAATRANSVPMTFAQEDRLALARYRVSVFNSSTPTGTHTPALESSESQDIVISGNQPVAGDYSFTAPKTVSWSIPLLTSGYNRMTIIVRWSTAPTGDSATINYYADAGNIVQTWTQSIAGNRVLLLYPHDGQALSAGGILSANTAAPVVATSVGSVALLITGNTSITAGTYSLVIARHA